LILDARQQNAWLGKVIGDRLTPTEQAMLALAANLLDRLTDESEEA